MATVRGATYLFAVTSPRRLAITDIAADPRVVQRLIGEGETLFVERKESDPKVGLGATVASFANMLGGWLLIGVDDHGNVVGYAPPGTADLQDYIRDLLRAQVDPLPPFAAATVDVGGKPVGVVHVAESSDTPHITRDGVIYVRNPGGKQRVTDYRDVLALARRGETARVDAERRLYTLPMVADAMRTPESIYGDSTSARGDPGPLQEVIVRATPYTISGAFAERALSAQIVEQAKQVALSLVADADYPRSVQPGPQVRVEARARGVYCQAVRQGRFTHVDAVIDAGGVIALRMAERGDRLAANMVQTGWLRPLAEGATSLLGNLDAYGRAAIGLELRGAAGLMMELDPNQIGKINPADLVDGDTLRVGGDTAVPTTVPDIDELLGRWTRELARAARLPAWQPESQTAGDS